MKAEEFAAAVFAAYPVPEETFARAKWMGEAADACQVLAKQYRKEEAALTLAIRTEGLTSAEYALKELTRPYSRVNVDLLKRERPDVFAEAVHVKQAFAEKTLGRRRLYDLVYDVIGEAVAEHEVVTVTDVRALLPDAEAALYIAEGDEFVRYAVVCR
mgnify:FL=1